MYRPITLKKAGVVAEFYAAKPRETYYSQNDIYIPRYDDVEHLVKSGKLIQIFGDFEASDKDARTATPKEFAG